MKRRSNSGLVDSEGKPISSEDAKQSRSPNEFPEDVEMPEANFMQHIFSLVTAARSYMGIKSFPKQEVPKPHKGMAKYHIDTLEVLKEKCQGNLSDEEEKFMNDALYELRKIFIEIFKDQEKNNREK